MPRRPFDRQEHIYRNDAFAELVKDGVRFFNGTPVLDLPPEERFSGRVPGGENMVRYQDGSVRYFTVFEAKKIQTFPKEYIITGSWGEALRQIGNAVPVLLANKIGASAMSFLSHRLSNPPLKSRMQTNPVTKSNPSSEEKLLQVA